MKELAPDEQSAIRALKASPNDFDCLPLKHQVKYFVQYLKERGDARFTVEDLQLLFAVADMVAPRSGKPLRPTPGALHKALEQLERSGACAIRRAGSAYEAS